MRRVKEIAVLAGILALGGCAVAPPAGPSVMVLPAKVKSFAEFQQDDVSCRQYASSLTGNTSPAQAANQSAATSAAAGTVLGAAVGAAIGAAAGNPAAGAAIGAGSGLVVGGASGVGAAGYSEAALQQRYDMSYLQCMSAKGESVPTVGNSPAPAGYAYPPANSYGYPYPSPYAYPYPYAYGPYGYYPGYFYPSVGFGFGGRGYYRR